MVKATGPAHRVCQYHAPTKQDVERMFLIRKQAEALIETIEAVCPHGPDRSAAIRLVRESMMTANAAIMVPQEDVVALSRTPCLDPAQFEELYGNDPAIQAFRAMDDDTGKPVDDA